MDTSGMLGPLFPWLHDDVVTSDATTLGIDITAIVRNIELARLANNGGAEPAGNTPFTRFIQSASLVADDMLFGSVSSEIPVLYSATDVDLLETFTTDEQIRRQDEEPVSQAVQDVLESGGPRMTGMDDGLFQSAPMLELAFRTCLWNVCCNSQGPFLNGTHDAEPLLLYYMGYSRTALTEFRRTNRWPSHYPLTVNFPEQNMRHCLALQLLLRGRMLHTQPLQVFDASPYHEHIISSMLVAFSAVAFCEKKFVSPGGKSTAAMHTAPKREREDEDIGTTPSSKRRAIATFCTAFKIILLEGGHELIDSDPGNVTRFAPLFQGDMPAEMGEALVAALSMTVNPVLDNQPALFAQLLHKIISNIARNPDAERLFFEDVDGANLRAHYSTQALTTLFRAVEANESYQQTVRRYEDRDAQVHGGKQKYRAACRHTVRLAALIGLLHAQRGAVIHALFTFSDITEDDISWVEFLSRVPARKPLFTTPSSSSWFSPEGSRQDALPQRENRLNGRLLAVIGTMMAYGDDSFATPLQGLLGSEYATGEETNPNWSIVPYAIEQECFRSCSPVYYVLRGKTAILRCLLEHCQAVAQTDPLYGADPSADFTTQAIIATAHTNFILELLGALAALPVKTSEALDFLRRSTLRYAPGILARNAIRQMLPLIQLTARQIDLMRKEGNEHTESRFFQRFVSNWGKEDEGGLLFAATKEALEQIVLLDSVPRAQLDEFLKGLHRISLLPKKCLLNPLNNVSDPTPAETERAMDLLTAGPVVIQYVRQLVEFERALAPMGVPDHMGSILLSVLAGNLDINSETDRGYLNTLRNITNLLTYAIQGPVMPDDTATPSTTAADGNPPMTFTPPNFSWFLTEVVTAAYAMRRFETTESISETCITGENPNMPLIFFANETLSPRIVSVTVAMTDVPETQNARGSGVLQGNDLLRNWTGMILMFRNVFWYTQHCLADGIPRGENVDVPFAAFQQTLLCAKTTNPDSAVVPFAWFRDRIMGPPVDPSIMRREDLRNIAYDAVKTFVDDVVVVSNLEMQNNLSRATSVLRTAVQSPEIVSPPGSSTSTPSVSPEITERLKTTQQTLLLNQQKEKQFAEQEYAVIRAEYRAIFDRVRPVLRTSQDVSKFMRETPFQHTIVVTLDMLPSVEITDVTKWLLRRGSTDIAGYDHLGSLGHAMVTLLPLPLESNSVRAQVITAIMYESATRRLRDARRTLRSILKPDAPLETEESDEEMNLLARQLVYPPRIIICPTQSAAPFNGAASDLLSGDYCDRMEDLIRAAVQGVWKREALSTSMVCIHDTNQRWRPSDQYQCLAWLLLERKEIIAVASAFKRFANEFPWENNIPTISIVLAEAFRIEGLRLPDQKFKPLTVEVTVDADTTQLVSGVIEFLYGDEDDELSLTLELLEATVPTFYGNEKTFRLAVLSLFDQESLPYETDGGALDITRLTNPHAFKMPECDLLIVRGSSQTVGIPSGPQITLASAYEHVLTQVAYSLQGRNPEQLPVNINIPIIFVDVDVSSYEILRDTLNTQWFCSFVDNNLSAGQEYLRRMRVNLDQIDSDEVAFDNENISFSFGFVQDVLSSVNDEAI